MLAAEQPQIIEVIQIAGPQMIQASPRVMIPTKIPPTIEMPSMIRAPLTVEYSMPSGPNRNVRRKAIPTDFGCAIVTTVVLPYDG